MLRPLAGHQQPRDTVRPVKSIPDFNLRIALTCPCAGQSAAASPRDSDAPVGRASLRIVGEEMRCAFEGEGGELLPNFHCPPPIPAKWQTIRAVGNGRRKRVATFAA